jgi:DNA replication protein DnaC
MNQVAHWLVGLEEWQGGKVEGQCISPIKSIYIVGDTGNGKSPLATAAYQASIDLSSIDGSDMRLGLTSMDQLHLAIQSSQSLERIDEVCRGHMVLDELRLKHLEHLHYGNAVSLVADILINRHHIWKQHGQQTIITTNVPPDELLSALDDSRITGRLLQQYHILPVTGSSYRTAN